ncbi:MAG TPA: hypothetical protein VHC95_05315 [Opitutales bacterium]|nr:hypothetical protein [Opitutales bacterium]
MKQKSLTPLLCAAALALSVAGAGCSSVSGNPQAADKNRNFLNLIKIEPHSYAETQPATLELHSNDVIERPNTSGTRVSLLAGLFTFEDY